MLLPLAAASLTLRILALLVSAAGFAWTVYEWHRSGARLKIRCTSFLLAPRETRVGRSPGRSLIAIEVTNTGRTATTVHAIGFKRRGKRGLLVMGEPAYGPVRLPKRLDAGESSKRPAEPDELRKVCAEGGPHLESMRPYVNSGHGVFEGRFDGPARTLLRTETPE